MKTLDLKGFVLEAVFICRVNRLVTVKTSLKKEKQNI